MREKSWHGATTQSRNNASRGFFAGHGRFGLCIDGVFPSSFLPTVSPELLDILVCPRTKKKLQIADTAVIDRVNALIRSGKCKEVSGAQVSEPATEGLYEPEGQTFYFVREDIPVLIYDNAVKLG